MQPLIKQNLNASIELLQKSFHNGKPLPHFIIDNFLEESFAQQLFDEFPPFKEERAVAEHGRVGGKATWENINKLGMSFKKLDQLISSQEFLNQISRITGIPDLLYDPDYIGGGTHENLAGQDMSVHIDFNFHPTRGWHRRVNALLYLNPEWEEDWGGALELWKNPWDTISKNTITKILPLWNRLVVFPTTETSWHGFEAVRIPLEKKDKVPSRRSFAIYLYTKERPASELGAMHSTVYYERPMPESIQPDKLLSVADWKEVQRLTVRRDELLKTLYSREKSFNSLISEMGKTQNKQEHMISSLKEFIGNLTRLGNKNATPLIFHPSSTKEHDLFEGFWPLYFLGFGTKVEVENSSEAMPGDWVLMKIRDSSKLQLVFLKQKEKDYFFGLQAAKPHTLLIPQKNIYGKITQIHNVFGDVTSLPTNFSAPLSGKFLIYFFLLLHRIKNTFLGKIKSPFLWKLSELYRKFLKLLGIHVPVILPPK